MIRPNVADCTATLEIAHHIFEILGGIEGVFLQRLHRRDAFLVQIERIVRLAHMNVDTQRVKGRRELRPQIAFGLRHDEVKDFRQRFVLIVIPELFRIGLDTLIEQHLAALLELYPAGIDTHLFITLHDAVVGLPNDCGNGELARQDLVASRSRKGARDRWGWLFDGSNSSSVIFVSGRFSLRDSISSTGYSSCTQRAGEYITRSPVRSVSLANSILTLSIGLAASSGAISSISQL